MNSKNIDIKIEVKIDELRARIAQVMKEIDQIIEKDRVILESITGDKNE